MKTNTKLLAVDALLEADALTRGLPLQELCLRCYALLQRSPELWPDAEAESEEAWLRYWSRSAVKELSAARLDGRPWLRIVDDRMLLALAVPGDVTEALSGLTRELVDYRLAVYRKRHAWTESDGFVCKVVWNKRDPILKLPDRKHQKVPEGATDVRLPDASIWQFRFAKEYVNVASPPGKSNQLADLLRGWFGPRAGWMTAGGLGLVAAPGGRLSGDGQRLAPSTITCAALIASTLVTEARCTHASLR